MKAKLIILTAIAAISFYSCSADRDETVPTVEKTKPENLKLKINSLDSKIEESVIVSDTIRMDLSGNGELPADGGDPKDVPPRK